MFQAFLFSMSFNMHDLNSIFIDDTDAADAVRSNLWGARAQRGGKYVHRGPLCQITGVTRAPLSKSGPMRCLSNS